jgi:hypothetical protein
VKCQGDSVWRLSRASGAISDVVTSSLNASSLLDRSLRSVGVFSGKWQEVWDWGSWEQGCVKCPENEDRRLSRGFGAILDEVASSLDIRSLFDNSLRSVGAFSGK